MIDDIRLRGDAQGLSSAVALAKMTAAAQFTRARVRVDQGIGSYQVEVWRGGATPAWVAEGVSHRLANRSRFGAGVVAAPPPNSQAVLAQAPACQAADGTELAGTACIIFNSRGLPVLVAGPPATTQVVYLRGPAGVFALVIGATGRQEVWRTTATETGTWRRK